MRGPSSSRIPSWLEPPEPDAGSVDPLGYRAEAEQLADSLLPGVTVTTTRARYLSFLSWATRETDNDAGAIDRWEVALSVGEHLRHSEDQSECSFLGKRLLIQRQVAGGAPMPRRLHVQTARILYSGLLRASGLWERDGLSRLGERVADAFGRSMPRRFPAQVFRCSGGACLSEFGRRERAWLREALLEDGAAAQIRNSTLRELGGPTLRMVRRAGRPSALLSQYLSRGQATASNSARLLHRAARLELRAMPLTRLFVSLYKNKGNIAGGVPRQSAFRYLRVREDPKALLADVAAHLRHAEALGDPTPPLSKNGLVSWLCARHREVKADGPWVSETWTVLRAGLAGSSPATEHPYRLSAFASLLADLGVV